jgi:IPT/TIG domain
MGRGAGSQARTATVFAALVVAAWGVGAGVAGAPAGASAAGVQAPANAQASANPAGVGVQAPVHAGAPVVGRPAAAPAAAAHAPVVAAPVPDEHRAGSPTTEPAPAPAAAAVGPATRHVAAVPAAFTDNQPGRVQQLPGEAGYALTLPVGATVTTTLTTPTLTCKQVPSQYDNVDTGMQLTFEVGGVYLYEQSYCIEGFQTDYFAVTFTSRRLLEVTPGVTATFTETLDATEVVATMDVPEQRGAATFDRTWDVGGAFSHGAGGFIGVLDEPYDGSAGGIPPYTQIPFNDTEVDGEGLGAYIEATPSSHAVEQNSVFGGRLQDQTSYIGSGSSFTESYANLGLPYATMNNPTVLLPATSTTTVDVTVTLSEASTYPVYIEYAPGGTLGHAVYATGTLTFSPGETTQEIPITVTPGEGGTNSVFDMYLLAPSYATTQSKGAVVTILAVNVTGVSPGSGLVQGGNEITVSGNDFTGATGVVFTPLGGTPVDATDYTVDSSTQITATVPDLTSQLDGFTVIGVQVQVEVDPAESPPASNYSAVELAVTSVDANTGPLAGATTVTITGSGFTWATDVVFTLTDGKQLPPIAVTPVGTSPLHVESPAAPGDAIKDNKAIANVQVEDDDTGVEATSPDTSADEFTYQGPTVLTIQPNTGPVAGGTSLTVNGSNFTDGTAVVFVFANGTRISVKATPGSSNSVSVATPAASAALLTTNQAIANVEVRVTTDGSSATSPAVASDQFTYQGPRVRGLNQTTGPLAGGTTVTVAGTWFTGATNVVFHFADGSSLSVSPTSVTSTTVTVKTPAVSANELSTDNAIADVEVQVKAGAGTTATSAATPTDRFTFQGPAVTSVSPPSGPAQGGTSITVGGHGFTGATDVLFHFTNGSSLSVSASATADTSLKVTTPEITASELATNKAVADVEVEVAAAGDTTATSPATAADQFTFQGPTVTKLSVHSGPVQGGTKLTITGTNLSGASEVGFLATDGTDFLVTVTTASASSVTVITPALPATTLSDNQVVLQAEVEVPLADGSVALTPSSKAAQFTMKGPSVKKLSPSSGLEGTTVTVSGANLTDANQVTFTVDGVGYTATPSKVSASSLSVVSPDILASDMKSGLAKAVVQVHVPLPDSTTAVSPSAKGDVFSYQAPAVTAVTPTSGPVAGGNKVTVKGKNLSKAVSVTLTIGSTVLTATPSSTAASSLTFTAPAVPANLVGKSGAKATVQVHVLTPSDVTLTSAATTKSHYTYRNPAVTKLAPATGPSTGGTVVTVTGTNLTGANEVVLTVGKTVITVTPSAASATSVTFTTPAIAASLLHDGKAVAAVQVGVPGAASTEAKSAIVTASHFTYVGSS